MEMDSHSIATTLQVLRDPAGIPAHPVVFQFLMVLTWVSHILFVNITLGSAGLSLYGFSKRDNPYWQRLSIGMTKAAKVSVSMLIVLGVAPLLFTQVIYDPQWYVSNILSASWAIGFIFTLILGYSAWFIFYYKNKPNAAKSVVWWGYFGLAMLILDGFIMHVLSYQALLPEQWMQWYAPNGQVDMSGSALHAWQLSRFLFFMAMSVTVVGVFLQAYAHYYKVREDYSLEYRLFVKAIGDKMATVGILLQIVTFIWWILDMPHDMHTWLNPMAWLLLAFMAGFAAMLISQKGDSKTGYKTLMMAVIMGLLIAIFREVLRVQYMLPFDYTIMDYKVMEDIPSTILFFLTLLGVGGLVGGFFLTALYKAGRTKGMYTASPQVAKLADSAVAVMIAWIAVFFLVGIWTWLRHAL